MLIKGAAIWFALKSSYMAYRRLESTVDHILSILKS